MLTYRGRILALKKTLADCAITNAASHHFVGRIHSTTRPEQKRFITKAIANSICGPSLKILYIALFMDPWRNEITKVLKFQLVYASILKYILDKSLIGVQILITCLVLELTVASIITRKMKFEIRKLANETSRKDFEAKDKWLENYGGWSEENKGSCYWIMTDSIEEDQKTAARLANTMATSLIVRIFQDKEPPQS
ncbi:hypothetical protein ACFE04_001261 [Oxalis oulophora]